MTNLTENEMAAIAAGLWEPGLCDHCNKQFWVGETIGGNDIFDHVQHVIDAPDMADPANLWRALENIAKRYRVVNMAFSLNGDCRLQGAGFDVCEGSVFAALVALYKAEHPQE